MIAEHHISGIPLDPYINGSRQCIANAKLLPTFDPASGEVLCEVPICEEDVVARAVSSAKAALTAQWATVTPADRGRMMMRVAQSIRRDAEYLAIVESLDSGKPLREAKGDIETAARYFEYYAGMTDKLQGDTIPLGSNHVAFTLHEPVGVTAHIIPWNFPLVTAARGLAPALATGSTAVVKPAEQTPLTALLLPNYLSEAGIPAGVVNVICGPGAITGALLVSHPDVAHVTFTGSVGTGKSVMQAAALHVASVTLELGGKSPVVVLADADKDQALKGVLKAIFTNAGQVCSAGSRLVIERGCSGPFLEHLISAIQRFGFGRGIDNPDIGPLISSQQLTNVHNIVCQSINSGAKLLSGGKIKQVDGLDGWFFEPTILIANDARNIAVQQEIFGPVLTVQIADDFDHACELAESTQFGLVAGIYTQDISKALRFSRHISSGQVFINEFFAGGVETAFGGTKNSGFGREKGLEGLRAYYTVKTVTARI